MFTYTNCKFPIISMFFRVFSRYINRAKNRCYFLLKLYCDTTLCGLWFVLGQTAVQLSAYCGAFFNEKKHIFFLFCSKKLNLCDYVSSKEQRNTFPINHYFLTH